jgi:hypothetical protein
MLPSQTYVAPGAYVTTLDGVCAAAVADVVTATVLQTVSAIIEINTSDIIFRFTFSPSVAAVSNVAAFLKPE